jgi:hypothetical protein
MRSTAVNCGQLRSTAVSQRGLGLFDAFRRFPEQHGQGARFAG